MLFSLSGIDCASPRSTPLSFADPLLAPRARLCLPRTHDGWHVSFFQLESTPLLARPPAGAPFAPEAGHHVVVFTLQYATADHARASGRFHGFVHARAMLAYAEDHGTGAVGEGVAEGVGEGEGVGRVVPWTEWGPRNTRFMDSQESRARYARCVPCRPPLLFFLSFCSR